MTVAVASGVANKAVKDRIPGSKLHAANDYGEEVVLKPHVSFHEK